MVTNTVSNNPHVAHGEAQQAEKAKALGNTVSPEAELDIALILPRDADSAGLAVDLKTGNVEIEQTSQPTEGVIFGIPKLDSVINALPVQSSQRAAVEGAFKNIILSDLESINTFIDKHNQEGLSDKELTALRETYDRLLKVYADGRSNFFKQGEFSGLEVKEVRELVKVCKGMLRGVREEVENIFKERETKQEPAVNEAVPQPDKTSYDYSDLLSGQTYKYGDDKAVSCEVDDSGCYLTIRSTATGLRQKWKVGLKPESASIRIKLAEAGAEADVLNERISDLLGDPDVFQNERVFSKANGALDAHSRLIMHAIDRQSEVKLQEVKNCLIKDAKWMHKDISETTFSNVTLDNVDLFDALALGVTMKSCRALGCRFDEADFSRLNKDKNSVIDVNCTAINTNLQNSIIHGETRWNAAQANYAGIQWGFKDRKELARDCGGMICPDNCYNLLMKEGSHEVSDELALMARLTAKIAMEDLKAYGGTTNVSIAKGFDGESALILESHSPKIPSLLIERVDSDPYKMNVWAVYKDPEEDKWLRIKAHPFNEDLEPQEAAEAMLDIYTMMDNIPREKLTHEHFLGLETALSAQPQKKKSLNRKVAGS